MKRSIITIVENLASKATVRIISDAGSEIWMSKPEIAHLLMVYQNTISNNLRAIFKVGILNEKDAIREHRYKRQNTECIAIYYSLEVIIALCYRVRSFPAQTIRQYIKSQIELKNNNETAFNQLHKLSLFSLN
ncbi:MAG: hypothetical protein ACLTWE_07375 [Dysgonomonas mossii]|uniref:hypothetical protein n=1 Tax=Dysgonomonas TaxID=156973 RepID=UPI00208FBAD5|nr:hypothetical protein [Dysgonomonas mossii]